MTSRFFKTAIATLLLLTTAACVDAHNIPSMADYSYVPPSKIGMPVPDLGLED